MTNNETLKTLETKAFKAFKKCTTGNFKVVEPKCNFYNCVYVCKQYFSDQEVLFCIYVLCPHVYSGSNPNIVIIKRCLFVCVRSCLFQT